MHKSHAYTYTTAADAAQVQRVFLCCDVLEKNKSCEVDVTLRDEVKCAHRTIRVYVKM